MKRPMFHSRLLSAIPLSLLSFLALAAAGCPKGASPERQSPRAGASGARSGTSVEGGESRGPNGPGIDAAPDAFADPIGPVIDTEPGEPEAASELIPEPGRLGTAAAPTRRSESEPTLADDDAPWADAELDAILKNLDPPTLDVILRSLEPIPTLEECLALLPDDPSAPWKLVLAGKQKERVEELERRIQQLREQAVYVEAASLAEEAFTIREHIQGEDHWETISAARLASTLKAAAQLPAESQVQLAQADTLLAQFEELYNGAEYHAAVRLMAQQLTTRRRLLGNDHPEVAASLCYLGMLMRALEDLDSAEKLLGEALRCQQRLVGIEHQNTSATLNELAVVQWTRRNLMAGDLLLRKSLAIDRRLLGVEHPDVATDLNNLAMLILAKGDYSGAEKLFRQTLATRRALYPEGHADLADSVNNLAGFLLDTGDYGAAELLFREALEMNRKIHGESHPSVATNLNNLSRVLEERGDYPQAEELQRQALTIRRSVFGDDSAEVAKSLNNLAMLYKIMGELEKAEQNYGQALDIVRRKLGDRHADVAPILSNWALLLKSKGQYARAQELLEEALAIDREVYGLQHVSTAATMDSLAGVLKSRGHYSEAELLFREALAVNRSLLGDRHIRIGAGCNNLAGVLDAQGDYAEAEKYWREALAIARGALGPKHLYVALTLSNLGGMAHCTGNYAEAERLLREALAMERELLEEQNPEIATTLNNLAMLLLDRGDESQAEELCLQSLEMRRTFLGAENPHVAQSLSNLANVLLSRGDLARAESRCREAIAMKRRTLDKAHPELAVSLHNLGRLLHAKREYESAEQCYLEALAIQREVFGNAHIVPAATLNDRAVLMHDRGDSAAAAEVLADVLKTCRNFHGNEHPQVAIRAGNLASALHATGDYEAAQAMWIDAARSFEAARLKAGVGGLERVAFAAKLSPLVALAACLARNGEPERAWEQLEANLSRGLLDSLSARHSRPLGPEERCREESLIGRLAKLDERIAALMAQNASADAHVLAARLRDERNELQAEFTEFEHDMTTKYGVAAGEVYTLKSIQQRLRPDAALIAWVDVKGRPHATDPNGEHWACVVRQQGAPAWLRLPGTGKGGAWTEEDDNLAESTRRALGTRPDGDRADVEKLLVQLKTQRMTPTRSHLAGVRRLIVLPAGWMAGIPIEALADEYIVSYAPSGTIYAWLRERAESSGKRERTGSQRLLALGDPVLAQPVTSSEPIPALPDHGVYLAMIGTDSNAANSGLLGGDVLLTYADQELSDAADLVAAVQHAQGSEAGPHSQSNVPVTVWRNGETLAATVAPGELGVRFSARPASDAVQARRQLDAVLAHARGPSLAPLPGTRQEVQVVTKLFASAAGTPGTTLLLGADASERKLDSLAGAGELKNFRFLHLATHAIMDDEVAMRSALMLSQEPVEDADTVERVIAGEEIYDGRLTAGQIVRTWELDADLVTLSACETALGKESGGEGHLGFAQALFVSGARSLLLSLWKVDDTATALLMMRFYENLLGVGRDGTESPKGGQKSGDPSETRAPMPKAGALREAKQWLRSLTADQIFDLCAAHDLPLPSALFRGEAGPMRSAEKPPAHPFGHPYYWSAFILIGDGD